jgi:hypothetical protein
VHSWPNSARLASAVGGRRLTPRFAPPTSTYSQTCCDLDLYRSDQRPLLAYSVEKLG